MLLGCCYFQVVLLLANVALVINNNVGNDQSNATEGGLFTDVIKNISRVNNVLQELIKNYKQLQKMYKMHSFENDYSTDSEIDEVFKEENRNYKTKSRANNDTTIPPTKKQFPGTAMMVSEEELEDITEKTNFLDDDKRVPLIQRLQAPDPRNNPKKVKKKSNKGSEEAERAHHKHSDEIKVPDNVFYDNVHPKNTTKKEKSKHAKSKHKKHKHKNYNQRGRETYSTTSVNVQGNARNVQKIVHTESFNQEKIWNEIVNKKPIKLSNRNMSFESKRDMGNNIEFWNNSRPKKTALVIVTKNKKTKQEPAEDISISITEEEKEINKELFKSNILRMAYGDACLKVVVKKCFKALKLVGKMACRNVKCKSPFKEKFIDMSKIGCLMEFKQVNTTTFDDSPINRGIENNKSFMDATRVGLEDCYPIMKQQKTLRNDTPPPPKVDMEVNILRDRFERACQRASSAKCNKACMFAFESACATYECAKSKNKAFKKTCKKQCKKAYKNTGYNKKWSDSSDSDSDNDSYSDSDSDDSYSWDK